MAFKDTLGERMKHYESAQSTRLTAKTPVIIRIDGKSFSNFTKKFFKDKPIDPIFDSIMNQVMCALADELGNCQFAYRQSDEISFFLQDYARKETNPWFDNKIQKLVSTTASMASSLFKAAVLDLYTFTNTAEEILKHPVCFDARAFNLPKEEVINYFVWRFVDCKRNSIMGYAQTMFSHQQLHKVSANNAIKKMKHEKNFVWQDLPNHKKYGWFYYTDHQLNKQLIESPDILSEEGRAWTKAELNPSIFPCQHTINAQCIHSIKMSFTDPPPWF